MHRFITELLCLKQQKQHFHVPQPHNLCFFRAEKNCLQLERTALKNDIKKKVYMFFNLS
jgi:hypothetical protein